MNTSHWPEGSATCQRCHGSGQIVTQIIHTRPPLVYEHLVKDDFGISSCPCVIGPPREIEFFSRTVPQVPPLDETTIRMVTAWEAEQGFWR